MSDNQKSGNYIANDVENPTSVYFANGRVVRIVDGRLDVSWVHEHQEDDPAWVSETYRMALRGGKLEHENATLRADLAARDEREAVMRDYLQSALLLIEHPDFDRTDTLKGRMTRPMFCSAIRGILSIPPLPSQPQVSEARERDEDGDLTMPVKVEWVIATGKRDGGDRACAECYPHGDMLIDGFRCYYHTALRQAGNEE
jgi:hypothetical protein